MNGLVGGRLLAGGMGPAPFNSGPVDHLSVMLIFRALESLGQLDAVQWTR